MFLDDPELKQVPSKRGPTSVDQKQVKGRNDQGSKREDWNQNCRLSIPEAWIPKMEIAKGAMAANRQT